MTRYAILIDGKAGAYGVTFPDLPGCAAMGRTVDAALVNAAEALRDWIEVTEESMASVPSPRPIEALRKDREVARALRLGAILASVPLIRESGRPVKANLSLDSGILKAIDAEAKRRKLTRSSLVEAMAREALVES
jgi:predicted RNase H-like HicB family nuclease